MTIRSWQDAQGTTTVEAEVVIVGTGPGGAAIGRVLAEAGHQVLFLEEGPPRSRFRKNYAHTMRYHMQENGAMVALGDAATAVAAGRGVGGGSLINSAICWRTPDYVLDGWVDVLGGDDRFRPEAIAPVFDELSEILGITKTPEGVAGRNNQLIVDGARKLGLEADLLHRNTPGCVGCGVCNFGCPSGGKASVDTNLVAMARGAGAVVQADVKVDRILVDGGRAVGVAGVVRHTDDGTVQGDLTVKADRVILCAGAVGTPRLLHVAGLADRLGPRVGKGLHLHPGNGVFGLCDEPVKMWTGATQGAYFLDPDLPGVLPHTLTLPPGALLSALGGTGDEVRDNIKLAPHVCGCLVMVSDKGEGTVGAKRDGSADLTYRWADEDLANMRAGLKRTCEVLIAGGATKLRVPVTGSRWGTIDDAIADIERAELTDYLGLYAAHPMATCRMGTDIDTSVVRPDGRTHGLDGLYVADGSIFPTSLGVNPQLTIMAMATILGRGMAG